MKSVLQDWVMELGLRHQGTLLTAVRGCDTSPKEDASKALTRCFRATILNSHCGDTERSRSFIESVSKEELTKRFKNFKRNCDNYPHHYVMHVIHSAEIIAYKHPNENTRCFWYNFYAMMVEGLHLIVELENELDERLNADEETFGNKQEYTL